MLVEDLIDLEVRMTISTRMFPSTPTVRTMLGEMNSGMVMMSIVMVMVTFLCGNYGGDCGCGRGGGGNQQQDVPNIKLCRW